MIKLEEVDKAVLRKLFARRIIGSHHIKVVTLSRCGWKSHERGLIGPAVDRLIKLGLIVWANKPKGAIALNPERMAETKCQAFERVANSQTNNLIYGVI